ncbi:hypothetical protein [Zoogloea sp. 1C4]|uniref:hypothetical protein n=1 Tax=Zoogloea sp. 1C4 TaxID=2570190 RepID=UPI001291E9F2|nr:hypothetical protein [Zoogloea sp. 1C4]
MSTAASGHKTDNPPFSVTDTTHRGLGRLLVLRLGDALKVRLTPIEAHTLALAMFAVRDGRSPEKELFFRLCRVQHKRNYVQSAIMRSRRRRGLKWPWPTPLQAPVADLACA